MQVSVIMNITSCVRKLFSYQAAHPRQSGTGLFIINGKCRMANPSMQNFGLWSDSHPNSLVGVYGRDVKVEDIIADLKDAGVHE